MYSFFFFSAEFFFFFFLRSSPSVPSCFLFCLFPLPHSLPTANLHRRQCCCEYQRNLRCLGYRSSTHIHPQLLRAKARMKARSPPAPRCEGAPGRGDSSAGVVWALCVHSPQYIYLLEDGLLLCCVGMILREVREVLLLSNLRDFRGISMWCLYYTSWF